MSERQSFRKQAVQLQLSAFSKSAQRETFQYPAFLYIGQENAFLQYDEPAQGGAGTIACRLKIEQDYLKLTRRGQALDMSQEFALGQARQGSLRTPEGLLMLETQTKSLRIELDGLKQEGMPSNGSIHVVYELWFNGEAVDERELSFQLKVT